MRRWTALALVLCAGCASPDKDVSEMWFGDLRSLFSSHNDSAGISVPPSPFGSVSGTGPETSKPGSHPDPGKGPRGVETSEP